MLAYLLKDSEWDKRRLALIEQHHLERVEFFRLEEESWWALERAQREQLALFTSKSLSAQAKLVGEHTRVVTNWQLAKETNRQLIRTRQAQEISDLNRQRPNW